jgi:hypothetical protein
MYPEGGVFLNQLTSLGNLAAQASKIVTYRVGKVTK